MKATLLAAAATMPFLAAPGWAQDAQAMSGDAEAGQTLFQRQCIACHVIIDDDGEAIAGRNARVGPNLYGVMGSQPGTVPEFNYSDDLVAYGETGVHWETENMIGYLQGPTQFLQDALDDPGARGRMAYQVRSEEDALNVAAFLAEHGQEPDPEDDAEDDADAESATGDSSQGDSTD